MNILMLLPYLPYPPSEGGQVRSYKLIKLLSRKHTITLVCFSRQHNTQEQISHMKQFCRKVIVIERGKTWTLANILRTGFLSLPFSRFHLLFSQNKTGAPGRIAKRPIRFDSRRNVVHLALFTGS